jgi:uncharacterized protein (TIGR02145 family)
MGFLVGAMTLMVCVFSSKGWCAVPSAPTLTVTTNGLTVTASWSAAADATGYTLYYAPYPAATPIGSVDMGSKTSFSATLTAGVAYYVAVKATNSSGSSGYSNISNFTIQNSTSSTVTDVEGNVYNTVTIGAQVWMKENLKTTKYCNGDAIPTTTANISSEASPKYQWPYNGDESNVSTYGRLYTWHAATDTRGVCPTGWHLPTDVEWTTLTDCLGGESVAGGHMREAGTTHWMNHHNTSVDNSSGFTALPGGYRHDGGTFRYGGLYGYWWSATESSATFAWYRDMRYDNGSVNRSNDYADHGCSVRCVKD